MLSFLVGWVLGTVRMHSKDAQCTKTYIFPPNIISIENGTLERQNLRHFTPNVSNHCLDEVFLQQ